MTDHIFMYMAGVYKYKSNHANKISEPDGLECNGAPIIPSTVSKAIRMQFGLGEERITTDILHEMLVGSGLTAGMNAKFGSLIVEEGLWTEAMELAMSDNRQIAFRASWALEWAYVADMDRFRELVPRFLDDYLSIRNESVNRVYSKMFCDMLRRGVIVFSKQSSELQGPPLRITASTPSESIPENGTECKGKVYILSPEQASAAVDKAFDLLLDPQVAVAVKVWQIELLSDLANHFDWIEEQLTAIVRNISEQPDCTPAMAAHARHYFKRIKKSMAKAEQ